MVLFFYKMKLKSNPTSIIPIATTPTKTTINCHFNTFFNIIISGKERPTTDIIKAREVPNETPFSIKTLTIGIIPAAFE